MNQKDELSDLRKSIDILDETIVLLFGERARIVKKIGECKKAQNITPLDKERWESATKKRFEVAARVNLPEDLVRDIFDLFHTFALKKEEEIRD